jgi:hypothetical protein
MLPHLRKHSLRIPKPVNQLFCSRLKACFDYAKISIDSCQLLIARRHARQALNTWRHHIGIRKGAALRGGVGGWPQPLAAQAIRTAKWPPLA